MRTWVRRLLISPVFPDEDKTRVAKLLYTITLTCAVLSPAYGLFSVLFFGETRSIPYVFLTLLLMAIVNFIALSGKVKLASIALVCILWVILTLPTMLGEQGIYHSSFTGYLIVIMIAGFLIGARAGLVFATLSSLAGLLILNRGAGEDVLLYSSDDAFLRWAVHVLFFYITAVLVNLATGQINDALARARRNEQDLMQRNQEFQRENRERERAEEAYRTLVLHSLQGLLIFQEGRIVFANPAIAEMLGYSVEELLTLENPMAIIFPEDLERLFGAMPIPLQTGTSRYEFRLRRKDDALCWAEVFPVQIVYQGIPAIQAATIDITERKQAEKLRRESEEELQQLSDATFEGIIISEQGKIVLANQQIALMLRCDRAALAGRDVMDFVAPESRELVLQKIQSGYDLPYDHIALRADGTDFPVEVHGRTMLHNGRDVRVTAIRDITGRKKAEQQALDLALERERIRLLQEFLSNISHDLKTPLSIINTSLYLLERLTDPERQQEKLQQIRDQTLLLERFIQDILTMSRLDFTPQLTRGTIEINLLLADIERQFRETAHKKNIAFELQLQDDLQPISGNETELRRAFVNLIENALKYTLDDGSVRVTTEVQDDGIDVVITDTGIGISEADLPAIFDRFYRTDKARGMDISGTGLGLAIVKKIVEMHGGRVQVESVLGKGSTFHVWLPCIDEAPVSEYQ